MITFCQRVLLPQVLFLSLLTEVIGHDNLRMDQSMFLINKPYQLYL
jgi:hypothetical protein